MGWACSRTGGLRGERGLVWIGRSAWGKGLFCMHSMEGEQVRGKCPASQAPGEGLCLALRLEFSAMLCCGSSYVPQAMISRECGQLLHSMRRAQP